jgi:hypothetical protein
MTHFSRIRAAAPETNVAVRLSVLVLRAISIGPLGGSVI